MSRSHMPHINIDHKNYINNQSKFINIHNHFKIGSYLTKQQQKSDYNAAVQNWK